MERTEENLTESFYKNRELIQVPIDDLIPSELNTFMVTDINAMMTSIISCGLITPLSVIGPAHDGKYTILSGERRFTALTRLRADNTLNMELVPCYLLGDIQMDVTMQKLIIETSNIETRDEGDYNRREHMLNIVNLIFEIYGKDSSDAVHVHHMMKYINGSFRYLKMFVVIAKRGSEKLKEFWSEKYDESFSAQHASKVAYLPEYEQNEIIERILAGEKFDAVYEEYKMYDQNIRRKDKGKSKKKENNTPDHDFSGVLIKKGKIKKPTLTPDNIKKIVENIDGELESVNEDPVMIEYDDLQAHRPSRDFYGLSDQIYQYPEKAVKEDPVKEASIWKTPAVESKTEKSNAVQEKNQEETKPVKVPLETLDDITFERYGYEIQDDTDTETVIRWCQMMIDRQDTPSDREMEALIECRRVVNLYFN